VFFKWATGSEDGSSVTVTEAGSPTIFFTVLRITGADSAQDPEISTVVANANSSTPDPSAIDPSWADASNLFIAVTLPDSAVSVSAYPSGYDLYQQDNISASGASGVAAKESTSSASENPGSFTLSGPSDCYSFTVAVKGA